MLSLSYFLKEVFEHDRDENINFYAALKCSWNYCKYEFTKISKKKKIAHEHPSILN